MSMTNEQREAIDTLKEITENDLLNYWEGTERPYNAIQIVLSLIKAQQEEISKYKTLYERALSDVVKADKQIYLMADYINKIANDIMKKVKEDDVSHYSLNGAIMLYFKRKAESSK